MISDWDEIKRLAADFQKVQHSSTLQKLSETNCIEVVNLLIEKGCINVIYTVDGKEYITPEHLTREVEDELYAHGGRVNLVELAKTLNVDLSRVNNIAEKMAKENTNIVFLLGQLINEDYVQRIANEINEKLCQKGEISVYELAINHFDLPTDFLLHNVMEKYLGTIIHARQDQEDSTKFFTQKYISRCKSKLRGALAGLTMPTPVSLFFQQIGPQETMYHNLINEINPTGVMTSKQKGALYIPHIYTKTQADWVDSFYKQNGYLEYEAVDRLGVASPMNFIKRQLPNVNCIFLSKCCVDRRIIEQIESALEECISSGTYLDASTILPSVMVEEDIADILAVVIKPNKQKSTQLFGTIILTAEYLDELLKPCNIIVTTKAKLSLESGQYQKHIVDIQIRSNKTLDNDQDSSKHDKKDDRRRKAAGGKGGGGTQGRETKTKSTKKHYRGGDKSKQSDSDDDDEMVQKKKTQTTLELITFKDIQNSFEKSLENEGLLDLAETLAHHYYPQLSKTALTTAHSLYEASIQTSAQNRRQTHAALQEKLNNLLGDIRLYEKGLKLLPIAIQPQLVKYLLKTLGTDVCNDLFLYVAAECSLNVTSTALTQEQRAKIIQDCGQEYKSTLSALHKCLIGSTSIEEFLTVAENALQACSMILKKVDKKKDRNLILCHKHGLLDQLLDCKDPALVLHLAVLVIFTVSAQNIVHASGKHISAILSYLQPVLSLDQSAIFMNYHDLVLKLLGAETNSEEAKLANEDLEQLIPKVKEIASGFKKAGVTTTE